MEVCCRPLRQHAFLIYFPEKYAGEIPLNLFINISPKINLRRVVIRKRKTFSSSQACSICDDVQGLKLRTNSVSYEFLRWCCTQFTLSLLVHVVGLNVCMLGQRALLTCGSNFTPLQCVRVGCELVTPRTSMGICYSSKNLEICLPFPPVRYLFVYSLDLLSVRACHHLHTCR